MGRLAGKAALISGGARGAASYKKGSDGGWPPLPLETGCRSGERKVAFKMER